MALADILSAMREIILDGLPIPADEMARREYYASKFLALSSTEIEDLAKNSPDKFEIYSSSIFVSQRNFIRRNLPRSMSVLAREWPAIHGQQLDPLRMVRDMHRYYPWQSTNFVDVGRNFVEYLKTRQGAIVARAPFLVDLALLEILTREVRRVVGDTIEAKNSLPVAALETMTVDALLGKNILVPTHARLAEFSWDVIEAFWFWNSNESTLPEQIAETATYGAVSRDAGHRAVWVKLSPALYRLLATSERSAPIAVESLAEAFVDDFAAADRTEEDLFLEFLAKFAELVTAGVVIFR